MKYFDDLYISGTIYSSGEEVAVKKDVTTLDGELKGSIEATQELLESEIDEVSKSVETLREELLGEDESLKSELEGADKILQENIDKISEDLAGHISSNDEKFAALDQKNLELSSSIEAETSRSVAAEEDLDSKITAETSRATAEEGKLNDKIEAETSRAEKKEGELEGFLNSLGLQQIVDKDSVAVISYVDENKAFKVKAEDYNRSGNDYVFEVSPESLSISSGTSKLIFEDGAAKFTTVVSGVEAVNDNELVIKKQLITEVDALDRKITEGIATASHVKLQPVSVLPSGDDIESNVIYLVPYGEGENYYEEFIWIDNKWEKIGDTKVDLTPYYTASQVEEKIAVVEADIESEAKRASEEEARIRAEIASSLDEEVKKINTAIAKEVEDRSAADASLKTSLEATIDSTIKSEETRAKAEEARIESEYKAAVASVDSSYKAAVASVESEYKAAVASVEAEYKNADTAILGKIDTLETSVNKHIDSFESEVISIGNRVGVNETSIEGLNVGLSSVNTTIEELKAKDTTIEANYKAADQTITESLSSTRERVSTLEEGVKTLATKEEVSVISVKVEANTSEISTLKEEVSSIESTLPTLSSKAELSEAKEELRAYTDAKVSSGFVTVEQLTSATSETQAASKEYADKMFVSKEADVIIGGTKRFSDKLFYGDAAIDANEVVVQSKLDAEKDVRASADEQLQVNIDAEVSRAVAAEESLSDKIEAETSRATTAEEGLDSKITAETARATAEEGRLNDKVEAETSRAEAKEDELQASIDNHEERLVSVEEKTSKNESDIATEVARAKEEEGKLSTAIAEESSARESSDTELQSKITALEEEVAKPAKREVTNWVAAVDDELSHTIPYSLEPTDGMVVVQVYKNVSGIMSLVICDIANDIANKQVTITLSELKEDTTFTIVIM